MSLPPNRNILKELGNPYYIETGTWRGDSLQTAIDSESFLHHIGIEVDMEMVRFCNDRFDLKRNPRTNLRVIHGDSKTKLGQVINMINEPITFFLDAHWQMLEGTDPGETPFPLLYELEQIREHTLIHGCKHTVIIDDWHIFYADRTRFSKVDILATLNFMNPNFKISYVANPVIDGILVAQP